MGEYDEHIAFEMGYNKGFKDGIKGSILKADYENRLKADMVAMLTEIQLEIEEESWGKQLEGLEKAVDMVDVNMIIQKKIKALKEAADD